MKMIMKRPLFLQLFAAIVVIGSVFFATAKAHAATDFPALIELYGKGTCMFKEATGLEWVPGHVNCEMAEDCEPVCETACGSDDSCKAKCLSFSWSCENGITVRQKQGKNICSFSDTGKDYKENDIGCDTTDDCKVKCIELGLVARDLSVIEHCKTTSWQCATKTTTPTATTPATGSSSTLYNPLGNINTFQDLIGRAIQAILGIVGAIALLMFVYGGIMYMTAGGAKERVESGRKILINSAIGLLIIFFSYTLASVFIGIFSAAAK